jgi:uncharacterized phiE125 gp8 family phage protein
MPLTVVTAADIATPVGKFLEALKSRLDIPQEDTYKDVELRDRIKDAIELVEADLWRPLFTTQYKLTVPGQMPVFIPRCPVQSIDSVKYYDDDNTLTTVDTDLYWYELNSEPAFLDYVDAVSFTFYEYSVYPVEITFTAGYGDDVDSLPQNIREAVIVTAYSAFQYPDSCHGGLPKPAVARCMQHRFRDERAICHL